MNPTNTNLQYAIFGEAYTPTLIDDRGDNLMYVGYCLPTCTGADSPKWLIKKIVKEAFVSAEGDNGTIQAILYPEGKREYSYKWSEREKFTYKVSAMASEEYKAEDYSRTPKRE